MSTYEEALAIKNLWTAKIGKGEDVALYLGIKEIHVGWNSKKEEPLKVIRFNPDKDGLEIYSYGKLVTSIIIIEGSMTIHNVRHIQKLKNAIQIFT